MDDLSNSGGTAVLIIMLLWLLVAVGILVWYLWAMARLFPRIGLKSSDGWIPIWNQWKLLERASLPGWVVLLSFVGLSIVPAVMLIMAMHRIGKEYGAGAGYTVLGVFIPPLWATLFANFVGASGTPAGAQAHAAYAPNQQFAGSPRPGFAPPPVSPGFTAPPAPAGQFVPPALPGQFPPPVAPQAPLPQQGFAAGQQPWAAGNGTNTGGSAPRFASTLGGETEAEYDRLAAESFGAPPAAPLGQNHPPAAFSWTAARASQESAEPMHLPEAVIPPVHPFAATPSVPPASPVAPPAPPAPPVMAAPPAPPVPVAPPAPPTMFTPAPPASPAVVTPAAPPVAPAPPAPPVPPVNDGLAPELSRANPDYSTPEPLRPQPASASSVQKPTGITGKFESLLGPAAAVAAHAMDSVSEVDEPVDFDNTVVVVRREQPTWVLELPDGTELPLENDVVVGRKPDPVDGSATLAVPDRTRTLSKSHVRLMRDGERWLVEDLGSTNGLVLLNEDGSESELAPGVRVEATRRMLFGTLEVQLRLSGDTA